uniref:Uncharacterized protein n=1 Tax=Rhizophora mucronata TaxID=61149 RepID=A0A2P2KPM0_RHIMU
MSTCHCITIYWCTACSFSLTQTKSLPFSLQIQPACIKFIPSRRFNHIFYALQLRVTQCQVQPQVQPLHPVLLHFLMVHLFIFQLRLI